MNGQVIKRILKRVLIGLFIVISFSVLMLHHSFRSMNGLPKGTLIAQSTSPTGKYTVKAYVSETSLSAPAVRGELIFNMENRKPKNIYWNYREDTATIKWVSDSVVIINEHKLEVPHEVFDFRRSL